MHRNYLCYLNHPVVGSDLRAFLGTQTLQVPVSAPVQAQVQVQVQVPLQVLQVRVQEREPLSPRNGTITAPADQGDNKNSSSSTTNNNNCEYCGEYNDDDDDDDDVSWEATTIAMGMLLGTIGEGYVVDEYEYEFAHKYANQYAQEHVQEHGAGTGKKEPGDDDEPATVGDRNSNSNNRLQWMVEELSDYFGCSCQGSAIAIPRWMLSSSSSALQQQQACTDDPGPGSLLQ